MFLFCDLKKNLEWGLQNYLEAVKMVEMIKNPMVWFPFLRIMIRMLFFHEY